MWFDWVIIITIYITIYGLLIAQFVAQTVRQFENFEVRELLCELDESAAKIWEQMKLFHSCRLHRGSCATPNFGVRSLSMLDDNLENLNVPHT